MHALRWLWHRRRYPKFVWFKLRRPQQFRLYSDTVRIYPRDWRAFLLSQSGGQGLQPELIRKFAGFADPDGTFFDVGANLGEWTAALRTRFRDCIAVEPDSDLCSSMTDTFRESENVKIVCAAASLTAGHAQLYSRTHYRGGQSLFHGHIHNLDQGQWWAVGRPSSRTVETIRLSKIIRSLNLGSRARGLYLKLDVEGAELDVLRDIEPLLREQSRWALVVEFNAKAISAIGKDPLELWRFLTYLDCGGHAHFSDGSKASIDSYGTSNYPDSNCDVILCSTHREPND